MADGLGACGRGALLYAACVAGAGCRVWEGRIVPPTVVAANGDELYMTTGNMATSGPQDVSLQAQAIETQGTVDRAGAGACASV